MFSVRLYLHHTQTSVRALALSLLVAATLAGAAWLPASAGAVAHARSVAHAQPAQARAAGPDANCGGAVLPC
ncbi:MAG: hypothetical protein ACHQ4H_03200 [Ktedonobacterales bacterium]